MSGDPNVRDIGHAEGIDGLDVHVGVDYDTVTLTIAGAECRMASAQAEEFAQLFVSACWQAARQVPGDDGPYLITMNADPPKPPYGTPERADWDARQAPGG